MLRLLLLCVALLLMQGRAQAHGSEQHSDNTPDPVVLAPGYETLSFQAPEPGSYELPRIRKAADALVLDSNNITLPFHEQLQGRISLLGFIYQACNDVNGCPLATFVMHQVRARLESSLDDPLQVQLLSLSFDRDNDTPESIAEYERSFGESPVSWRFLTTPSDADLEQLLSAWDQPISRTGDGDEIKHVLRVYLVDAEGWIRNIYSASLLHADTLANDVFTLLLEAGSEAEALVVESVEADLHARAREPQLGLPSLSSEHLAALSAERVALGKALFFDRRLSGNNTFSCAMCHVPRQGFTVLEMATAVGVEGRTVKRNAPTLLNVGLLESLFHDARERRLEQQVWIPLLSHDEMDNPSISHVLDKIAGLREYPAMFEAAFGSRDVTMETLGSALADYQRTLLAGNSAFDRWYYAGETTAIDVEAQQGFALFTGKAGCANCHHVGESDALLTDQALHNTGIGYRQSQRPRQAKPHSVRLAPGVELEVDPAVYAAAAETPPIDLGRYEVTQRPEDRWAFRTPGLRNVALTAPYMHDGSLRTLAEVVEFYDQGGEPNPLLSPFIRPLNLSAEEKSALVSFMNTLTSNDIRLLVDDALNERVGDTGYLR